MMGKKGQKNSLQVMSYDADDLCMYKKSYEMERNETKEETLEQKTKKRRRAESI